MYNIIKIFISLDNGSKVVHKRTVNKVFNNRTEINKYRKRIIKMAETRYIKSINKLRMKHPNKDVKIDCLFIFRNI